MNTLELQKNVTKALQEYGIGSVLFRNAIGKQLGLNITDIGCLNYLLIKHVSTPTELARYTGLTTGSTTAMIDRLEQAKLITRQPNPHDRRGTLVKIQPQARQRILPMVMGAQAAQTELLNSYSDVQLEAIADFLTRFTHNINEQARHLEKR